MGPRGSTLRAGWGAGREPPTLNAAAPPPSPLPLPVAPQARQHWLVVAREPRLQGPLDLTAADAPLLEHMLVGAGWAAAAALASVLLHAAGL